MRDSLKPGLSLSVQHPVDASLTVPRLLPQFDEFARMPNVLATGYLIGLVEWSCMRLLAPHLDPDERTVGRHVDLSHESPTLPGGTLDMTVELDHVDGRDLDFAVLVSDDYAVACRGRHRRVVIDIHRFEARLLRLSGSNDA
jgi:fluoroacetyl-CoA thioesterase